MLIDDCGNRWKCIAVYWTRPYTHIKIGRGWSRMVNARMLGVGVKVVVGAPKVGKMKQSTLGRSFNLLLIRTI